MIVDRLYYLITVRILYSTCSVCDGDSLLLPLIYRLPYLYHHPIRYADDCILLYLPPTLLICLPHTFPRYDFAAVVMPIQFVTLFTLPVVALLLFVAIAICSLPLPLPVDLPVANYALDSLPAIY